MCNEREEGVWFIHAGENAQKTITTQSDGESVTIARSDCDWKDGVTVTANVYSKDVHHDAGVGLNRKFDATLVEDIDRVFRSKWNLPEYLPFRECVKMAIQDGIIAGMEKAADKYEAQIDEKNKRIEAIRKQVVFWRNSFSTLLTKCKDGVHAFEQLSDVLTFISKVVHHGENNQ